MEMSGQLHAPAALSPGKEPLVLFGQKAAWASISGLDTVVKKYKSCSCALTEHHAMKGYWGSGDVVPLIP
jgi:hypothetical protein